MSSLTFDKSLADRWIRKPFLIDYNDHVETVQQQLAELEGQSREIHYYKLVICTVMSHLSSMFSRGTSGLRLEPSSQTELYFDINGMTPQQLEEIQDPSWNGPPDDQQATEPTQTEEPKHDASNLTGGLDGRGWKPKTTRASRAAAKAIVKEDFPSRPPDSTSSASTSAEDICARIYRVSDGMFFVRGKLAAYKKLHENAKEVPALPAACVEVKPPVCFESEKMDTSEAKQPIVDAGPQIIQQAQFIFQMWDTLSTVWCLGICGRLIRFTQFKRDRTPEPEATKICKGQYYKGDKSILNISTKRSRIFIFLDENGHYTPTFIKWWKLVIVDVQKEYNTYIQAVNT